MTRDSHTRGGFSHTFTPRPLYPVPLYPYTLLPLYPHTPTNPNVKKNCPLEGKSSDRSLVQFRKQDWPNVKMPFSGRFSAVMLNFSRLRISIGGVAHLLLFSEHQNLVSEMSWKRSCLATLQEYDERGDGNSGALWSCRLQIGLNIRSVALMT